MRIFRKLSSAQGIVWAVIVLAACIGCSSDKSATTLKIGDPAPDFTATDLAGNIFTLSAFKGKPVVLRFWSTDCKYCRADTPIFNEYFNRYKEKGLIVVYINRGSDEAMVRGFVDDLDIPFPVIIDSDQAIARRYNIRLDPQTIVISPEQTIIAAILGGVSKEEFQALLGGYFPEEKR